MSSTTRYLRSHHTGLLLFIALLIGPLMISATAPEGTKVLFGKNFLVGPNEEFKNIVSFGGNLKIQGHITNDIIVFASNLDLQEGGFIDGDAIVIGGNLQQFEQGQINGEIIKVDIGRSLNKLVRSINYEAYKMDRQITHEKTSILFLSYPIMFFIGCLGIGMVMFVFLPKHTRVVWRMAQDKTLASWVAGVLAIVALPLLIILMSISIIGIPLIPILALAVAFASVWGYIIVALLIGGRLIRKKNSSLIKPLALGLLTMSIVMYIPYIGKGLIFLFLFLGLGAVILSAFGTNPPSVSWRVITKEYSDDLFD
ncbi:MAG: hypothetical protein ACQEP8_06575 [Chlamydiota bacterium]